MSRPTANELALSVVVPAFNEEERLQESLPRIRAYLADAGLEAEVLVVDDGSVDRTAGVARERLAGMRGRVLGYGTNRGKGHAFRTGFLAARGRWVLLTDADLSTPIEEHARLADRAARSRLDLVIGSRRAAGARVTRSQGPLRRWLGDSFAGLTRRLTGLRFLDTQCGFKLMRRERVLTVVREMRVDGFAFDVELLLLCGRRGLRVGEEPVTWVNDERSKVDVLGDPMRMLFDVGRIRLRHGSA